MLLLLLLLLRRGVKVEVDTRAFQMMLLWEPDKLIGIRHGGPSSWRVFRGLLARANYGAVAISRRKSRTRNLDSDKPSAQKQHETHL